MVTGFRRLGGDFLRSIQSSDTLSSRAFGVLVLPPPPVLRRELEPPAPSGIPSITGCDMLRVAFVLLVQKYIVGLECKFKSSIPLHEGSHLYHFGLIT